MTHPHQGRRVRLGGRTAAFDAMIAAACAVATSVLTDPRPAAAGAPAARLPEPPPAPPTPGEAYTIGYRAVADARTRPSTPRTPEES